MKVVENSIIYTVVKLLKNGVGFFLLPVYTAYLTTEDYGIVSIVTSLVQVVSILVLLSLHGAGTRYHYEYKNDKQKQRELWGTIYSAVVLNAIFVTIILFLFHDFAISPFVKSIPFYPYLAMGILICLFQSGYQIYQQYLKADQQGKPSGILDFSFFLLKLVLTITLVVGFEYRAVGVIFAWMATDFVFFCISHIMLRSSTVFIIRKDLLTQSLKYSLPLLPHALAGWSLTMVDRIFLNNMTTTSEVGIYTIGFQIANVLQILMAAVVQAYSPWFFEKITEGESGLKKIRDFSEIFVLLFSLAGLFLTLFSPELLKLVVTKNFEEGWIVAPFLVFAYVFHGIYFMVISPVFVNRTHLVPVITISTAAINIVLNYYLIGPFGKIGASVASLITMILTSVISLYFSLRTDNNYGYRWKQMYIYASLCFILSLTVFLENFIGEVYVFLLKFAVSIAVLSVFYYRYSGLIKKFIFTFVLKK